MKKLSLFILILFLFSACDYEDYDDLDLKSMAICKDGIASNNILGISYKCKNYDLISLVSLETMDASRANDSWGWTDPISGKEFALIGLDNGTGFVDISDPVNPVYLGKLPTQTISSIWRDLKVYKNHVYIVADFKSSDSDLDKEHGEFKIYKS